MKIEGTVNIMGMNEVVFRQKYRGKFYEVVQYLKAKEDIWVRVYGGEADGFQRSQDDIISSIKSLSFNPNVDLVFNDGIMYVNFLQETLTDREWKRLEKFVDAKREDFKSILEEMILS